jgi:hypothetical protein
MCVTVQQAARAAISSAIALVTSPIPDSNAVAKRSSQGKQVRGGGKI